MWLDNSLMLARAEGDECNVLYADGHFVHF